MCKRGNNSVQTLAMPPVGTRWNATPSTATSGFFWTTGGGDAETALNTSAAAVDACGAVRAVCAGPPTPSMEAAAKGVASTTVEAKRGS